MHGKLDTASNISTNAESISSLGKIESRNGEKLESEESNKSYLPISGTDTHTLGLPQREPNERNDRNKERESRISIKEKEEESRDNRPDDSRLSSGERRRIRQRNKRSAIYGTSAAGDILKGVPHTYIYLFFV